MSQAVDEFVRGFEELLQVPRGSLNESIALKDIQEWDSLAVMEFMSLADEKYGVRLAPKQFRECRSIGQLAALVNVQ
jgi:acyl carrier protein